MPHYLLSELTDDELKICKQVESLAFDQAGCRMIQKRLEEKSAVNKDRRVNLSAALIHVMMDILPDVMTNQFGNYLC